MVFKVSRVGKQDTQWKDKMVDNNSCASKLPEDFFRREQSVPGY